MNQTQLSSPECTAPPAWIEAAAWLPPTDTGPTCLQELGTYSIRVLAFDEDEGEVVIAWMQDAEWVESESGCRLHGVTHWMPLPAPPAAEAR